MYVVIAIAVVLVLAVVALRLFASRAPHFDVSPANVTEARTAGKGLLESRGRTFLVVVAHPDDAEWWSGGTLIQLAANNRVILVDSTSGDKALLGLFPDMGKLREGLETQAAKVIGYERVIFLRHGDQHLADAKDYPGQIEDLLREYRPDGVLTFDTVYESTGYRHVDHEAAGRTTIAAVQEMEASELEGQKRPTLFLTHSTRPNVAVDATPVLARKAEALDILFRYQQRNPFWWVTSWIVGLRRPQASGQNGSAGGYERIIVREELFRRVEP